LNYGELRCSREYRFLSVFAAYPSAPGASGAMRTVGAPAHIAVLNIMWRAVRGSIPNDSFNVPMVVQII
jgi:hypothetical protein